MNLSGITSDPGTAPAPEPMPTVPEDEYDAAEQPEVRAVDFQDAARAELEALATEIEEAGDDASELFDDAGFSS